MIRITIDIEATRPEEEEDMAAGVKNTISSNSDALVGLFEALSDWQEGIKDDVCAVSVKRVACSDAVCIEDD
jgi:hypothetical protein